MGDFLNQIACLSKLDFGFRQISLGKHDSNARTALMGQNELALKPAHIDAHQRLSHDNRIEIRRKHLLLHALGRIFAHESAFAVMHAFDDAFIVAIGRGHVDDIARCRAHVGALHQSRCVLTAKLTPVVQADERVAAIKFDHSSLHKH